MRVPPIRWTMMFMGCAAMAINYIDRANLAVAAPFIRKELGIDATIPEGVPKKFYKRLQYYRKDRVRFEDYL